MASHVSNAPPVQSFGGRLGHVAPTRQVHFTLKLVLRFDLRDAAEIQPRFRTRRTFSLGARAPLVHARTECDSSVCRVSRPAWSRHVDA